METTTENKIWRKAKKHLSFESLRKKLSSVFREVQDWRISLNYSVHDVLMSGFACMFFQDPSLLEFQKRLKESKNADNLQTMFDINGIPEGTQIRRIIDEVPSETFRPIFKDYFKRLQRGKHLSQYQFLDGLYLCSIDGTQYYSSYNINCSQCIEKKIKSKNKEGELEEKTLYAHSMLQAAIMHPDVKQVIPLMPEEISNSDGYTKQDCELNAFKRIIPQIRSDHPQLPIVIVGDGLFSKQAVIDDITQSRMNYILVAKPKDHQYMFQWVDDFDEEDKQILSFVDSKDKTHVYEWYNQIPLHAKKDSIKVNFFSYKILEKNEKGEMKINYNCSWVSDLPLSKDNVKIMVEGARSRWKIENDCFNNLKNRGYNLEHNYGHGKKYLCYNFMLLTLLSFFFHQIFELTDSAFKTARERLGRRINLWNNIRMAIRILIFPSWEILLDFVTYPKKYDLSLKLDPT